MRIWAKIIDGDKIAAQTLFATSEKASYGAFCRWLAEICASLDESTPAALPVHFEKFAKFHRAGFGKDDFVEAFGHDSLVLEDCGD